MEHGPFEGVFPIKYGDNSIAMLVYHRVKAGAFATSWAPWYVSLHFWSHKVLNIWYHGHRGRDSFPVSPVFVGAPLNTTVRYKSKLHRKVSTCFFSGNLISLTVWNMFLLNKKRRANTFEHVQEAFEKHQKWLPTPLSKKKTCGANVPQTPRVPVMFWDMQPLKGWNYTVDICWPTAKLDCWGGHQKTIGNRYSGLKHVWFTPLYLFYTYPPPTPPKKKHWGPPLRLSLVFLWWDFLALLGQVTGQPSVLYFATNIFKARTSDWMDGWVGHHRLVGAPVGFRCCGRFLWPVGCWKQRHLGMLNNQPCRWFSRRDLFFISVTNNLWKRVTWTHHPPKTDHNRRIARNHIFWGGRCWSYSWKIQLFVQREKVTVFVDFFGPFYFHQARKIDSSSVRCFTASPMCL